MELSKQTRARPTDQKSAIGLMAIGSSGPWEIALDQTSSGRDRWFAQIEGPSVYIHFEIPALKVIAQAIRFLAETQRRVRRGATSSTGNGTLPLGSSKAVQVSLIRDDEFTDRYFLSIESKSGTLVRFTLAGKDLMHLTDALRQLNEDMSEA